MGLTRVTEKRIVEEAGAEAEGRKGCLPCRRAEEGEAEEEHGHRHQGRSGGSGVTQEGQWLSGPGCACREQQHVPQTCPAGSRTSRASSPSALSPGGPVLVASSAGKWGLDHKSINRTYIQMIGLPPVCLPLSVFMLLSVCHTYVCK